MIKEDKPRWVAFIFHLFFIWNKLGISSINCHPKELFKNTSCMFENISQLIEITLKKNHMQPCAKYSHNMFKECLHFIVPLSRKHACSKYFKLLLPITISILEAYVLKPKKYALIKCLHAQWKRYENVTFIVIKVMCVQQISILMN